MVLALVNQVRQAQGLAPLSWDPLLQRVGDAFCGELLRQDRQGHYAADGVAPYLRYLLAGGHGFHRENVGSYSTTGEISASQVPALAQELTRAMLEETPPEDGHRRTLLDPWATHMGVGLAFSSHRLVLTHEVATLAASFPRRSPFCQPATVLSLEGKLAPPWQLAALEVLWEPLPGTQPPPGRGSYSYPPRKAWYEPREYLPGTPIALPGPISLGPSGRFTFKHAVGSLPGVELVVLWGRQGGERNLVPLALSGCVVSPGPPSPPLLFWASLAEEERP